MQRNLRVGRDLRVPAWRSVSTFLSVLCAGGAYLGVAGCSGSGSGTGPLGSFGLESTSVTSGQIWQINRPIEFLFSQPVDFDTVNLNTISIADLSGQSAIGTFQSVPGHPRLVVFQPRCPAAADFSDAGFKPGNVQYRIRLSDQNTGAGSVRSTVGDGITVSQTIFFQTPDSASAVDLFLDPVPGPPTPIPGSIDQNGMVRGTRFVFSDGSGVLPFQLDQTGTGLLPGTPPQRVPLNLYSDVATQFSVLIELNQPVLPTAENISSSRIHLQFQESGEWRRFSTRVELVANCTDTGATVRVSPIGVLPQNRNLRVRIAPEFEDLIGDRNLLPLTEFARMQSSFFTADGTPAGAPVDFVDEFLEEFLLAAPSPLSFEDDQAVTVNPRADWKNGRLAPGFGFEGTGGPGGNFDWHLPPNTEVVLDTSSTLIQGGPGGIPTTTQLVVNGLVNVRNLFVPAGATLRIQGPNPVRILCSGNVQIDGLVRINGGNAQPVFTINMPHIPEPGAEGNGGGGAGGVGSFLTNQVTPRGGRGNGAFGVTGGGGEGGESGWHPDSSDNGVLRRAAGGGGGSFGLDSTVVGHAGSTCPDQTLIGLDAESGFPGATTANAATRPGEVMPHGGMQGPRPFTNVNGTIDDFWGTMVKDFGTLNASHVVGELSQPHAGAGGGAGGDATRAPAYPPVELIPTDQDKGAGGGGGAGSFTLLALGDISFGPMGRIQANGGHGSGGENTVGTNRVAGGSGGGSGGHIILQTASKIDFRAVPIGTIAITARGGQGGAGAGNLGGAASLETLPTADAQHEGVSGPGDDADNPWIGAVPMDCLENAMMTPFGVGVVRGAGGDGGPGIVQLHVPSLPGDIINPGAPPGQSGQQVNLRAAVRPAPIGYASGPGQWVDQLVPSFGRFSEAQSKWIPLGGVAFPLSEGQPLEPLEFLFGGTTADGFVQSSGGVVSDLAPILAPAAELQDPGLPAVDAENPRRLLLDASELTGDDEVYRRNPNLFRRFRVRASGQSFDVESGAMLPGDVLALHVSSSGPALPTQGTVQVIPRYFAIATSGIRDALPTSASVRIDFQATTADGDGQPDPTGIFPTTWATDIETLNFPDNTAFRFLRFRVLFDLQASELPLTVDTPRPEMDFLRTPFRF